MSRKDSFRRKIEYLVAIAVLLGMLYWLGAPAIPGSEQGEGSPGGVLAQLRDEHELNQGQLGEIDPTSETIKLATFGLRGVASSILWTKANRYKREKDWTNMAAAVKQLAKLEPNRISVWIFQAHNLSYNVSWEFDDYRDRYHWVIKGIAFLKEGMKYNKTEPRLRAETGWYLHQKIGRSDERKQFRKLFKEDDAFHGNRKRQDRDNWLVAREWFLKAEDLVELRGKPMQGKSPLIFYSDAPMCLIKYAQDLENEGTFGPVARRAWKRAAEAWADFGNRQISSAGGRVTQLDRLEFYGEEHRRLKSQLKALNPGLREKIEQEKNDALTEEQRRILAMPSSARTTEQEEAATEAKELLRVTDEDVAKRIAPPNRSKAVLLAKRIEAARRAAYEIQRDRSTVAYDYWALLAHMEQTDDALDARKAIYQGNQAIAEGDPEAAAEAYRRASFSWARLIELAGQEKSRRKAGRIVDFGDDVSDEGIFTDDVISVVHSYRSILDNLLNTTFPDDFALQDFVREQVNQLQQTASARYHIRQGDEAMAAADPNDTEKAYREALKSYERGLVEWRKVIDEFPSLLLKADPKTLEELNQVIRGYAEILGELGEPFPPPRFALQNVLDAISHGEQ